MKSKTLQLNSSTVLCCEGCSLSSVVRNAIVVVQSLNSSFFKLFIYKRGKMIWICWAKSKLHNKTATSSVVFQFRRIMWLLSDCCSVESNYRVELWTVIKANIPLQSDNCISAHSRKLSQLNTANTPERRRHKQRKIVWELTDVYCLTKCISSPVHFIPIAFTAAAVFQHSVQRGCWCHRSVYRGLSHRLKRLFGQCRCQTHCLSGITIHFSCYKTSSGSFMEKEKKPQNYLDCF